MSQGEGLIRKGFDAVNRHDVNGLYELYSPNVVMHSPQYPEGMRGRENVRRQFEAYLGAFPDMKIEVSNIVAKDDVGWFELKIAGTHKGTIHMEAGPVPPTNMLVNMRAALFWRFSRGTDY